MRAYLGSDALHRSGILCHQRIGSQQRNAFDHALRDQYAVERILVKRRQGSDRYRVLPGDRELR